MNVVDSSAWLAYFADEPTAELFASAIEDTPNLVVPTICIYEVFKRIYQQRGEGDALRFVALMHQGHVVDIDSAISLSAAKLSIEYSLPMADSLILAVSQIYQADLWTQDVDFEGIEGVQYINKG